MYRISLLRNESLDVNLPSLLVVLRLEPVPVIHFSLHQTRADGNHADSIQFEVVIVLQ